MGTTTNHSLRYPEDANAVAVPADVKKLADDVDAKLVSSAGGTVSGNISFTGTTIVQTPTANNHAATKLYVDAITTVLGDNPAGAYPSLGERLTALELGPIPNTLTIPEIVAWGHSYLDATPSPLAEITAEYPDIPLVDYTQAGTGLTSDGIWTRFLRTELPGTGEQTAYDACRIVMYGLNDIDQKPVGGTNSFGVTRAFEMWVSRMRAAGPIYEDTDASFAFTGAWAVLNVTDRNTGTGYHYTTSADASYTITTPSTFPGGTVAVRISSQSPGATAPASPSPGATHTAYVDGIVAGRVVARSEAAGTENTSVLRVRNVPAGEQTITVQIDDITGLTAVDGWWWECPVDAGPLVVLAAQPYLPAGGYAAFLPSVKGDAQIDALNAILRNMVTLFGPRVVVADSHLAAMNANPTHFKVDLVHPNTTGCALIGQAIIDAIAAKQYTLTAAS